MNVNLWLTEGRGQVVALAAPFPKTSVVTKRGLLGSIPTAARYELKGKALRFMAWIGLRATANAKAVFSVMADGKVVYRSDSLLPGAEPQLIDLDVRMLNNLELLVDGGWQMDITPVAYWADAKIVTDPSASFPTDIPVIVPFLNEADAPAIGEIYNKPVCQLPKLLFYRSGQSIKQRLMVTGPKPISIKVIGLPAGLAHEQSTQTLVGRIDNTGNYPITIIIEAGKVVLKHFVTIHIGMGVAQNQPLRGWVSPRLVGPILRQQDIQQAGMGLINSGLADLGYDWLVIGEGWQGERGGRYHAIQPNERFAELPSLIAKAHSLGLKTGLWLSTERRSTSGYLGTHADSWIGTLKEEFDDMPRGKLSFAAEDIKQWNEWRVDGFWLYGPDLTIPDVTTYINFMSRALPTRLLSLEHNLPAPNPLKLASGLVLQQLWESNIRPADSWFVLRQQLISLAKGKPDLAITGRLALSESIGYAQVMKARRPKISTHTRRLQFGMYALLGLPIWIQDNPLWLLQNKPNDLYWLTNQEVLALQRDGGEPAKCIKWDEQHQTAVWSRHLADGTTVLAWVNLAGQVQVIPFDVKGRYTVRDLWRHEQIGDIPASGELSCEVAPYGIEIWQLRAQSQLTKPSRKATKKIGPKSGLKFGPKSGLKFGPKSGPFR